VRDRFCMYLIGYCVCFFFFFSSRRRHTRSKRDWSSDVCSSDGCPERKFNGVKPVNARGDGNKRANTGDETAEKDRGRAVFIKPVQSAINVTCFNQPHPVRNLA